jgi:hypothetical protein
MVDNTPFPSDRLHILSDFTGGNLAKLEASRQDAHQRNMAAWSELCELRTVAWENGKVRWEEEKNSYKPALLAAWREGRYFNALKVLVQWYLFSMRDPYPGSPSYPPKPYVPAATDDEHRIRSGKDGENRVLHELAMIAPSDWQVVCGYQNAFGETDLILVTTNGLMNIEVKAYSGDIYCDGDVWIARNVRGRQVYQKNVQDRGGRAPNQQVNEVANGLENFFDRHASTLNVGKIRRAVVFAALNARIMRIQHPGVDLVCAVGDLTQQIVLQLLPSRAAPLDVARVIEAIKRDHAYHEKRRNIS